MTAIGETLRRERIRRHLNLDQIARETKIAPKLLEAIEQERFDRLPGGVFAKSFVRQYARMLGLDEDEIVSELERSLEPEEERFPLPEPQVPKSDIHVPPMEKWESVGDRHLKLGSALPALALVIFVMLVCSAVYSWMQRSRHTVVQHGSAYPAQPMAHAPAVAPPAPEATPTAATPAAATEMAPAPAAPVTAPETAPDTVQPPAPAPADAPAAAVQNPNAPVRVEITAQQPAWVSARVDGKYAFSGTLQQNQTRTADANETVLLRLGNAGGVSVSLNGKPVGPLGEQGQVRTVQLTSGGFQIVPPEPKPAVVADPF
ncbi:MAG TPA: RodZ domain-containing protein [Bryobacteraceae bacterium]|nr:RodZ domain-containing protein [Bryobacteraceae bacterium]